MKKIEQVTNGYATFDVVSRENGILTLNRFHPSPLAVCIDNPITMCEKNVWPWDGSDTGDRNRG